MSRLDTLNQREQEVRKFYKPMPKVDQDPTKPYPHRHRFADVLEPGDVVRTIDKSGEDGGGGTAERFEVCYTADGGSEVVRCRSLLFATGGSREGHRLLSDLGVRIVPPVPSLFTLDLAPNHVTSGLAGISVPEAAVRLRWLRIWRAAEFAT